MNPSSVFEKCFALHQLPATLRLRNLEWGVYFTIDGEKSVAEIQLALRLSDAQRSDVFDRLVQMDLIREKKLNLEEHIRVVALSADLTDPAPKNLEDFVHTASSGESPSLSAVRDGEMESSPKKQPAAFSPLPPPAAKKTMSLLAVIRFIQEQNRDKTAGQLAVYRVFMGVSTGLLKKNGIHSLRFQSDRLISDADLQHSISENVHKALRKPLPETVYR